MFELPEVITFARQFNTTLKGKVVREGRLGNAPHKFVWYNRTHAEFGELTRGKIIGISEARGRWLLVALEPGYVLVLGECGGKVLFHAAGTKTPVKYHLWLEFEDGSSLTATTQMWGAMELYERGKENQRQYLGSMRLTPVEPGFTFAYFSGLLETVAFAENKSVKGLLTQDQLIPGLGNAIAQDIQFKARLHPKFSIRDLAPSQSLALYRAILDTVDEVIRKGGRQEETNLFGETGGYIRLMDSRSTGKPCPACSTPIQKIQYLGGSCYFCPACQPLPEK